MRNRSLASGGVKPVVCLECAPGGDEGRGKRRGISQDLGTDPGDLLWPVHSNP